MPTAKTRIHLANRTLQKLQMVGLGQSPDAEDTEKVDEQFEAFSAFLSSIGLYSIADEDDIDLEAFDWLATYFAYFVATDFGKPQDDSMRQAAEYNLRRINVPKSTGEVLKVEYF